MDATLFRDVLRDCANAASLHVSRCRSEAQFDLIPYYEGRRDAFLEVLTHLEEYPEDAMPADLAAVLRDPTIVLDRDKEVRLADGSTLHDALERWRNAPSDTASADLRDV